MISKVQNHHREKMAYIYLRQSTMAQVRHHQESTERQYALKERALELGWGSGMIRIIDSDLGISGTQMVNREGFKTLVAEVSLKQVGAVFALEASRLSRSNTDWHRLIELCSITDTLIIDEDGCYNPADFNDQLLLGLKGTMSQAELHFLRARLLGGKINKAKKGKLRFPLPVGFCYDEEDAIVVDPDEEVRSVVELLFSAFRQTGSAYGVVHTFVQNNIKFPKRSYGGIWDRRLIWGQLTHSRVLGILKNPSYAGVYVYGRYKYAKKILSDGTIVSKVQKMPMDSWQVTIKDHHKGYISWDEFVDNQKILAQNQTNGEETLLSGSAREGLALLQGLLLCGTCGHKISVRYKGNGGIYPTYECNWRKREGFSGKACLSVRCDHLDTVISQRVLEILKPDQITIALKALEEIEQKDGALDNQWKLRIQRAEYEGQLAQKRYEEVDPSNRLVAATLEKRWNDKLLNLEQIKQQYSEYQQKEKLSITAEQKKRILTLAKDLPRLWKASTTQAKDRKRILRLLIKDITIETAKPKRIILHLRWQGGVCEDINIELPQNYYDRIRYPETIIKEVRKLSNTLQDHEIAGSLNREGRRSATGKPFSVSMVKWIRYKHNIPVPILKRPNEYTVKEISDKFGVTHHMVYYWIERGYVKARKINNGSPWFIKLSAQKEKELYNRGNMLVSAKKKQSITKFLNTSVGGAL
jgi:DNA invertase Pin-like site-specific DNA recombinase/DNA-binding transcriptional MerR regulator